MTSSEVNLIGPIGSLIRIVSGVIIGVGVLRVIINESPMILVIGIAGLLFGEFLHLITRNQARS